jgi:hypothetical protein
LIAVVSPAINVVSLPSLAAAGFPSTGAAKYNELCASCNWGQSSRKGWRYSRRANMD